MRTSEIDSAVEVASRLRDAIAAEIDGARGERLLLQGLDSNGLFARAAQRASFLAEMARLERALASALAQVGPRLGQPSVTIERLRTCDANGGAELAETLCEAKALAGALQEVDQLNLELARRALVLVRGYVEAFQPAPRAYDRYGGRTSAPALAVVSTKG